MTLPTGHPDGPGPLPSMGATGQRHPLSPERVRTAQFGRTPLGRRGLNEDEVRLFLVRVAEDLAAADADKAELRGELNRLRNWFRERGVDVHSSQRPPTQPGAAVAVPEPASPSVAMINLMSRAQQAADAQVAQAEAYCRRLVLQAREYYDRILQEAAAQANEASERLAAVSQAGGDVVSDAELQALEQRVAWLRTFAEVAQVQLRAVFESLAHEVDKLDDIPEAADAPFPARR